MGRLATAAIITLAFTGAAVESFAATPAAPTQAASPAAVAPTDAGQAAPAAMPPASTPPQAGWMRQNPMGMGPMGPRQAGIGPMDRDQGPCRFGMGPKDWGPKDWGPMGMGPKDWGPKDWGPMGMGPRPEMRTFFMRMHEMQRNWGLFASHPDKNLSKADVQILAEAILLRHGNHSWKVTDVAEATNGAVTFAYATADGSVIARFSVDRHTGRFTRID
jgi:hypothetical protein